MSYTVTQNTTFLTAASVLQKVISFFYFILIARLLGAENTGQYFFALTFTTIFTVVADFGLSPVLTREASRYPENSQKYVNTILWTKVLFGVAAYLLVVFFINILGYPAETKLLVTVSGVTMFFDNLQSVFNSLFRARKNLIFESVAIVAAQFVTLVVGTVALFNHWPLVWLIIAYAIPSFLNFIYLAVAGAKVYGLRYSFAFDWLVFKFFAAAAVPFALAGIIGRLYSYSDSLLMSKMLSAKELGWWSVPYKITFAFQFIPIALSASVYPVFSSLYTGDKSKIGPLFEKSWRYLFYVIFPLSIGLFVLAEPAIKLIYGDQYAPSVMPLKILMISLVFGYLALITGALINATNHQRTQTMLLAVALVLNLGLNLVMLPRIGIIGAAFATLASNFVLCAGGYYFSRKYVELNFKNILVQAGRTFWPAMAMGLTVYLLARQIHFLYTIPIGALVYGVLIFASGGLSATAIKNFVNKLIYDKNPHNHP